MDRYYRNNNGGNQRRRYSRSRSRERNRDQNFRRRNSRSRSRDRDWDGRHQANNRHQSQDLYRDIIEDDYHQDNRNNYNNSRSGGNYDNRPSNRGGRDYDERRDRDRDRDRDRSDRDRDRREYRQTGDGGGGRHNNDRRYNSSERADSEESEQPITQQEPTNVIFISGLKPHISKADIMSTLIQADMPVSSIRIKRRRGTGASRGFATVDFNSVEQAARWMELTQGVLTLSGQSRVPMRYVVRRSDWYCVKCGFSNFNRRLNCFKCDAPREDSEIGSAEGRDEVSYIVTKKIMLRNLDALTNEDGVLMAMQQHAPHLAKQINKVLVSRDPLTQTSRGICYLHFESLVDSMNLRNLLTSLDPPLRIDDREVMISYCIDRENREILPKTDGNGAANSSAMSSSGNPAAVGAVGDTSTIVQQYTLDDVPRLAEYSASLYATTPEEQAHYLQYYTEYYINEINKGNFSSLPTNSQIDEYSANSGAAVALSAIQRKQKKMDSIQTTATKAAQAAAQAAAAAKAALVAAQQTPAVVTPKGNDGKTYPTPDVSLYQYDETSGYYYDPTTGLYYDAHSQYYYNNETGAYLYWDQRKSTYVLATPAAAAASVQDVVRQETTDDASKGATAVGGKDDEQKKDKKDNEKHDKVKVAKKIVKDMEKWAKQLNQKKDYTAVATPQPILPSKDDEPPPRPVALGNSYADVGFTILEKKERVKLTDFLPKTPTPANKLISTYGSDSDDEKPAIATAAAAVMKSATGNAEASEKDYVDFQKLTCLLCKRAFQSAEILQKHLKMSNLHKENLQKFNMLRAPATSDDSEPGFSGGISYRDRAKERRLKYGESEPPPNRTRERFESEMKSLASRSSEAAPAMPISSNNVGSRLLQKMGWSEGQGLGRSNQGRTNIIETESRSSTAGLGTKGGMQSGDSYKTYIKKMMKTRYESV